MITATATLNDLSKMKISINDLMIHVYVGFMMIFNLCPSR